MGQLPRTGVNTVTRKLRDGTVTKKYYNRKTGEYLGTDRDAALALMGHAPEQTAPGSFAAVCESYLASQGFRRLAPKSQEINRFYLDRLRDMYGQLPAAAITRPVVVALREALSKRPWYATHMLSKLRLLLQHAVDIGVLKANPALKPGGVQPPRRHEVWSVEQTEAMLAGAGPDIRLACALLLYTAQRPSDALEMQWGQIQERDGRLWLTLRQAKTSELIDVPAHRDLEALLRAATRRSVMVVPSPTGLRWSYRNFCRSWDRATRSADFLLAKAMFRAGFKKEHVQRHLIGTQDLQRRDLRRTGMVRMAEAGATAAQIAAVSGHSIAQTTRILDTYIPRRGEVAAGAIDAWERGRIKSVVVPMRKAASAGRSPGDATPTATATATHLQHSFRSRRPKSLK